MILEATLGELADGGYGELCIEAVAARAGVGKSTVYRYWAGKLPLVADALETLKQPVDVDPDAPADSPRAELERSVRALAELLSDSPYSACIPAIVSAAERDPDVRRFQRSFSATRRQRTVDLILAAIDAAEIEDRDPEIIAEELVAPLFFRRLMTPAPFPPDEVPALLARVLGPRPGEAPSPR